MFVLNHSKTIAKYDSASSEVLTKAIETSLEKNKLEKDSGRSSWIKVALRAASCNHEEAMVDVTLSCVHGSIRAHNIVLSAFVIMKDIEFADLRAIVELIHRGKASAFQSAESLEVKERFRLLWSLSFDDAFMDMSNLKDVIASAKQASDPYANWESFDDEFNSSLDASALSSLGNSFSSSGAGLFTSPQINQLSDSFGNSSAGSRAAVNNQINFANVASANSSVASPSVRVFGSPANNSISANQLPASVTSSPAISSITNSATPVSIIGGEIGLSNKPSANPFNGSSEAKYLSFSVVQPPETFAPPLPLPQRKLQSRTSSLKGFNSPGNEVYINNRQPQQQQQHPNYQKFNLSILNQI
uniref:BTB domain-containing protein n=1 Tax=Tetranychus urticae TaxID=32264 RepID=T1KW07_TETUR